MKSLLLVLLIITSPLIDVSAQVGMNFPDLKGVTLTDLEISLPEASKGKYLLAAIAFSKKAEDDLITWFEPAYNTFLNRPTGGIFPVDELQSFDLYFIPMFSGLNKAAAGTFVKKAKKGIDASLQGHTLVFKGDAKPFREALKMDAKDAPYFFVVDPSGKIIHMEEGACTTDKVQKIEALLVKE